MKKTFTSILLIFSLISPILAQAKKQIIFAVLNDGRALEPIVQVEKGKIVELQSNSENGWKDFSKMYYTPKTTYSLIFGGISAGKIDVVNGPNGGDCAANMATSPILPKSDSERFGDGFGNGYYTEKRKLGTRRLPTAEERTEIEKLIRAEMKNQKVSDANLKGLRSHNLTAIDANNDKKAEFVGSYWLPTAKTERAMMFIIAEKGADGKYALAHTDFQLIKQTT